MRVLQVNSVCGRGSTGRIVVALHDALRARGDECRVAYGRGHHDPAVDAFRIGTQLSVGVHAGLSRLTDRQGFYSARATRQLLDGIEESKPDVIHLHNVHGYYLNMPLLFSALQKYRAPVIWTLHDCWGFTGHCAYFDFVRCEKWRTHCGNCPQKGAYPTSYGRDSSRRNFDEKRRLTASMPNLTLVTPSDWLAGLVSKSFLDDRPIEVIKNGVDQTTFRPTDSDFKAINGIEGKIMVLGVASPWSARKGIQDFVELSSRLTEQHVIVLVGVDATLAQRLPSSFIAIDRVDSSLELAEIYSAADIYFNPTYEDNYPTTNIEAISCGTPVITYETGGSPESVASGHGAVVPKGDLDRVAAAIADLSTQHFGPDPLNREFNEDLMRERYLSLYDRARL